jgi:endo-1,3-1,4-beta-glycanase ExoK
MKLKALIAALALFASQAEAQTIPFFSKTGAIDTSKWYISNGWSDGDWMACQWQTSAIIPQFLPNGIGHLNFTIGSKVGLPKGKYACGELQSYTQQAYGMYQVNLKTAAGPGLNTAFFTYTANPHDEIDLEFLGRSPRYVSLTYWVNGISSGSYIADLGFDSSADFHTYAFNWQPGSITWYADGKVLFQTKPGKVLPAHASKMYLELWAGAAAENAWLGAFKYTAPVTAEYSSVSFTTILTSR